MRRRRSEILGAVVDLPTKRDAEIVLSDRGIGSPKSEQMARLCLCASRESICLLSRLVQVPYDRDPYLRSGKTESRSQDPRVRCGLRKRRPVEALFSELKNLIGLRRLRRVKFVREQFYLAAVATA